MNESYHAKQKLKWVGGLVLFVFGTAVSIGFTIVEWLMRCDKP